MTSCALAGSKSSKYLSMNQEHKSVGQTVEDSGRNWLSLNSKPSCFRVDHLLPDRAGYSYKSLRRCCIRQRRESNRFVVDLRRSRADEQGTLRTHVDTQSSPCVALEIAAQFDVAHCQKRSTFEEWWVWCQGLGFGVEITVAGPVESRHGSEKVLCLAIWKRWILSAKSTHESGGWAIYH